MINNYMYDLDSTEKLEFYEGYESFCYQNCLRIVLQTKGLKYPELYINGALGLVCNWNKEKKELIIDYGHGMRSLLSSIDNKVTRIYCSEENVQSVFEKNIKLLEENGPIIVGIDTFYMPYAINYQKNHAIHTAILVGFDLEKKYVTIIDWYKPWFFKGEVNLDDFLKARNSNNEYDGTIFSGTPIKNNFAHTDDINKISEIDLIKEMFNLSLKNCRQSEICDNSNQICYGVDAYKCLKGIIIEYYNELNAKSLQADFFEVWSRYKFFLQYILISQKYIDLDFTTLIKECRSIIDELDVFRMLLMKMQIIKNERNKERLIFCLDKIISLQEMIQNNIESVLESLS